MSNWTLFVGYFFAVLMWIVQLWVIRGRPEKGDDDNWPIMAPRYRLTMRVVVLGGLVLWAVASALALFEGAIGHSFGVLDGYRELTNPSQGPLILLLVAFFTGCLRLFVERTLRRRPREDR